MTRRSRLITILVALVLVTLLLVSLTAVATAGATFSAQCYVKNVTKVVATGETWVVDQTTRLSKLTVAEGGIITAPGGYSVTLTVNGVETGGRLVTTKGVDARIAPGTYQGNVVLTVTEENLVKYEQAGGGPPPGAAAVVAQQDPPPPPPAEPLFFPFRQALYVDETGVVQNRSVWAAVSGGPVTNSSAKNLRVTSTGENFNGVFVTDAPYTLWGPKINLTGNGRSDFVGYGAAIVSRGEDARVVVDGARIVTDGVVRSAIVADTGSNMIVKNSYIQTNDGVLPSDYIPTIDTTQMRSVPWMLSLSGNCRATNLLGTNTMASYVNSYIGAEGWGVLSTDGCTTPQLTAINSTIAITGPDGYGSYGIGDATERFLGCTFDVATYATISRGSFLYYGDSTKAAVAKLNKDLDLGLTASELRKIPVKPTIVNSDRFGIMWHGGGTLDISGGTQFNTGETTFLDKGQAISIIVDGSKGAKLNPANAVIFQLMDDDDPGPVPPDMTNTGVWHQATGDVAPQPGHDLFAAGSGDAVALFKNIKLTGDFYNGMRGDIPGPFGPPSPRNMGLTFQKATITGVISSSTTANRFADTITAAEYMYLGEVDNTPSEAVNNGVIVTLTRSNWVVTGTSYLTKLVIDANSSVMASFGHTLTMTVDPDGVAGPEPAVVTPIHKNSTYTGYIVLTVN
jgi:hypothetical protein